MHGHIAVNCGEHTAGIYRGSLDNHILPALGGLPVDAVGQAQVAAPTGAAPGGADPGPHQGGRRSDIVFPDRSLIDMARRRPRSEEEFAEVNGVGAAKLKAFATPFLAAIGGVLADAG